NMAEEREASRAAASGVRSPTFSASFLDFAEEIDPPIRVERGDPSQGTKSRAVDRPTGEYVEWQLPHWQSAESYYYLYSADGTKSCTATVQQEVLDLSGVGKVALYKVRVLNIHKLAGDGSWSEVTD